jgi:hypothetical protein
LAAVANVAPGLGAERPDGELDQPRKRLREARVDLRGIDPGGELLDDAGAPVHSMTPSPVEMLSIKDSKDPGSVEEVVNQAVDGHQRATDLDPIRSSRISDHQKRREGHGDQLG